MFILNTQRLLSVHTILCSFSCLC